jgi:hypothetical protein
MTYEDTIRVADLKTRPSRLARVAQEVGLQPGQVMEIDEFLHPRVEEIADVLPAALGRRVLASGLARGLVGRLAGSGRIVRTTSLRGYLQLFAVSRLRPWRRASLRHRREWPASGPGWACGLLDRGARLARSHPQPAADQRVFETHARQPALRKLMQAPAFVAAGSAR